MNKKQEILENIYKNLNDMQQKAVFTINGPVSVLAGAGSGKTTVLVNRIAYMLKFGNAYYDSSQNYPDNAASFLDGYSHNEENEEALRKIIGSNPPKPYNILAITFTNKAANELKERIAKTVGDEASSVWSGTFHSFCARILRRHIDTIGYSSSFTIYDTSDSERVIKDSIKNLNITEKEFPPKTVLKKISRAKDNMETPQMAQKKANGNYYEEVIAKIYDLYQKTLKSSNALDFDDMILKTIDIFKKSPEILEKYQNQFKYIMVDEYQDTNKSQHHLVTLLALKYKNLCIVGDDDQSIYKFRGANVENILNFQKEYPNSTIIKLEQNYRSTKFILGAANSVIENNTKRQGKKLWTSIDSGEKVVQFNANDEFQEGGFIVKTIEDNVKEGFKYSDHAILYRANSQSSNIENHLIKSGVPYRILSGIKFYNRKEVKDMLAYLHLINNHNDSVRLKRIINEPKRKIGNATIEAAEQLADYQGISIFEVISRSDEYAQLAKKANVLLPFAQMITKFSAMLDNDDVDLEEFFQHVFDSSGYYQMLVDEGFEGRDRIENVNELKSNIARYCDENEAPTLSGFLEEISLIADIDNYDDTADAVVLMTIHASKGLEFPVVFIVALEENIFPSIQTAFVPEDVEEERRLCYVAITRAKKKLFITTSNLRYMYGKTTRNPQSRFLDEISSNFIVNKPDKEAKTAAPKVEVKPAKTDNSLAKRVCANQKGSASKSTISFALGESVKHKIFGTGVVVAATPMGNDTLLEVDFSKVGTKKIMQNFANLQRG